MVECYFSVVRVYDYICMVLNSKVLMIEVCDSYHVSVSRTQDGDSPSSYASEILESKGVRNRRYEFRGDTIGCR